MPTPFKLKSGNVSAFKNLGNSPVKGKGDNLKRIMTENKVAAKKAGTFYANTSKKVVKKVAIPSLKAVTTGLGYGTGAMAAFDLLTGPAAILGLAAHGAYKSGQKHSGGKAVKGQKSFMADAKKNTKSIWKK